MVEGKNVEKKMDPVFKHPIFDSAREKVKSAMGQAEKSHEYLWKLVVYLLQMWGQQGVFYRKTG